MTLMNEDPRKQEIADRMARVVGLPIDSVNALIADIGDDELTSLLNLDDAEFKKESVRLVNKAQQRQFTLATKPADIDAEATPVSGIKISSGGPQAPTTPISESPDGQRKLVISKAPEHENFPSDERAPIKGLTSATQLPGGLKIPTPGNSGLIVPSGNAGGGLKLPDPASTPPLPAPKPPAETASAITIQAVDDTPTLKANPPAEEKKPVRKLRIATAPEPTQQPPAAGVPSPPTLSIQSATPPPVPVEAAREPAATQHADSNLASGIQPVEPEARKPLTISRLEEEKLEKESPQMVRKADLGGSNERQRINDAFKTKDTGVGSDKKTLMLLIGGGAAAFVVLILISYAGYRLFRPTKPIAQIPTPGKSTPTTAELAQPSHSDQAPSGRWAWKGEGRFEESFENKYLLTDKSSQPFTIEMWLQIHKPSGLKKICLTTVGEKFSLGIRRYRRHPVVFFNVPGSHRQKLPAQSALPTGRGWLHLAGVYDPAEGKKLDLYVNGQLTKTVKCSKDPQLNAAIFIIQGDLAKGSYVLVDEIRMTASALYGEDFTPTRVFEPDFDTVALLHLEKNDSGAIPDHAQLEREIVYYFSGGSWAEVDTNNYQLAADITKELEKQMLAAMQKKLPPAKFNSFQEFWKKADAEAQAKLLEEFEAATAKSRK